MKSSALFVYPPLLTIIIDSCQAMPIPSTLNKCQPMAITLPPTGTKIQSPQMTFPPVTPVKDSPTVVDTAVFAGMSNTGPVQTRDGTPRLSFVPIGGMFIDADT